MNKKYWKERCKAAEKFIELSPCDPDINKKQEEAFNKWILIKVDKEVKNVVRIVESFAINKQKYCTKRGNKEHECIFQCRFCEDFDEFKRKIKD